MRAIDMILPKRIPGTEGNQDVMAEQSSNK